MNRRQAQRIRTQLPSIVFDKNGILIKFIAGGYELYVYGNYAGGFPTAFDAEMAGSAAVWELLKERAA